MMMMMMGVVATIITTTNTKKKTASTRKSSVKTRPSRTKVSKRAFSFSSAETTTAHLGSNVSAKLCSLASTSGPQRSLLL